MHITTSRSILSAREDSLRPDGQEAWCHDRTESLWLSYTRLAAWPSIACGATAVFLHQMTCELASEPTHWGTASFIAGLCCVLAFGLLASKKRTGEAIAMATVVFVVSTAGLLTWEHCSAHEFALAGLVGLSVSLIASCFHSRQLQAGGISAGQVILPVSGQAQTCVEAAEGTFEAEASLDIQDVAARRPSWSRHAVAIVLGAASFIYLVAVPSASMVVDMIWPSSSTSRELTDMTIAQTIQLHVISAIVMLIFLAAGASIGSFLNVVIFRLPRRRPLFLPSSACPGCGTEIAGLDNIPVISWLRLGGRCRSCHIAISPRYPIIETIVGLLFVLFYFRELLSGGANLPIRSANMYNGIVWILLYTKWDLVTLYFFHMFVLVSLLAWAMINYDRFRVPISSGLSAIVLVLVLVSAFPHLNPIVVAYKGTSGSIPAGLLVGALGCCAGVLGATLLMGLLRLVGRSKIADTCESSDDHALAMVAFETPATRSLDMQPSDLGEDLFSSNTNASEVTTVPSDVASGVMAGETPKKELYGDSASKPNDNANIVFSLALVGTALGYESVIMVLALTALMLSAERLLLLGKATLTQDGVTVRQPLPTTLWVFVSSAILLVFWQEAYGVYTRCAVALLGGQ